MIQIRIHGRGGQGVVTAAELLSVAAFQDGKFSQAFPSFGSERMGAPVMAFCRIHDQQIRSREPVYHPDGLLIQDPTLLHHVDVFSGVHSRAIVLINSERTVDELELGEFIEEHPDLQVVTIPASDLSMKHLGRPIANVTMVAGYAGISGVVSLESLLHAISCRFPDQLGKMNGAAAAEAYEQISASIKRA